jgi:hypothetical protein
MNQHSRPIWFAALVTPWAAPLALVLWSTLVTFSTVGAAGFKDWPVLFAFFLFGLPVTYAAMLIFGVPYVLWLRARGVLTFPFVCIGAVLVSVAAMPAYAWLIGPRVPPNWFSMLLSVAFGLLSGSIFCIAAGITFRPSGRRIGAA